MSLRVAGKIAPVIVVTFAKGKTIGCMLRLVWHDFAKQRRSRMKRQQTLEDLNQILVTQQQGIPVYVSDVATTQIGSLSRYGAVTQDGQGETVEGIVLGLRGANARQVVADVRQALEKIQTTLPDGVTVKPFYDRGDLVNRAIHTVQQSLTEAIVLVLILLLLFLGNLRAACVVATILPLSALGTFLLMRQFGLSANLMSLGGLAIAIGLLVDAAVVVVENIEAHQATTNQQGTPRAPLHVMFRAVQEVAVPVTAGMIIIMLVFVPLLSLQGLEGKLFAPVAIVQGIACTQPMFTILGAALLTKFFPKLLSEEQGNAFWRKFGGITLIVIGGIVIAVTR